MDEKLTLKLSIFLHKKEIMDFDDCIKEESFESIDTYKVNGELGLDGKMYIHHPTKNPPSWKYLLDKITDERIEMEDNSSNKAVVIFKYRNRYLSIVYGYGKSMLDDSTIVKNFGLKVAANLIDPENIRSLNSMTIEDTIVDTQKQATEYVNQDQFQTDKNREILKSISGSPNNETIAKFMVGTDSLSVTRKMSMLEIKENLIYYFNSYNKDDYKGKGFEWIDNIQKIKDAETQMMLNDYLVQAILNSDESLRIAPNKIIEWENIISFRITGMGRSTEESIYINQNSYFEYIRSRKKQNNVIDKLKRDDLRARTTDDIEVKISNIYDAIIYETLINGQKYILCYGDWFEVDTEYYTRIKNRVKRTPKCAIQFPNCKKGQSEGEYNESVVSHNSEYVLLDQKNYIGKNYGRSKIEPCDIFTKNKQLIHVKIGGASSKLSHLFSQGLVSARILSIDKGFKAHINDVTKQKLGYEPIGLDDQNNQFEIVFAIIDKREEEIENVIPFFSLVNLAQVLDNLDSMNFKNSLMLIKQEV